MSGDASVPRLWARTRRWTLGEPRSIAVVARPDGRARILFLRSRTGDDPLTGLWAVDVDATGQAGPERPLVDPADASAELSAAERARRERVRETAAGVVSFSHDGAGRRAVTATAGGLLVVDCDDPAATRRLPVDGEVFDPRIDPTGRRAAFCSGPALLVADLASGRITEAAGGAAEPGVTWGRAEYVAAEEMGRSRGFWWSPTGDALLVARVDDRPVQQWWIADPSQPAAEPVSVRYPAAGTDNADVGLWRVDLDADGCPRGEPVELRWDRSGYGYLAAVAWPPDHPPVLAVQRRDQRAVRWLVAEPDGDTRIIAEDTGEPWVEIHPGAPAVLDGDLVRIADVDGRRRLLVGDAPLSPPEWHVRSIAGVVPEGVVVTASTGDPAETDVWRVDRTGAATRLSAGNGVHAAAVGGTVAVVSRAALNDPPTGTDIVVGGRTVGRLASRALPMPSAPDVDRFTTPSGVRVGVVLPRDVDRRSDALPVLMDPYGGPHGQRVVASRRAWLEPQWWADQGFAVVVADGRGTPGVSVAWEHAVHRDLADVVLADQVAALEAAVSRYAQRGVTLDAGRVAIRGWSFGGYLAALAVIRRPDVFHAAVAGAPPTDWRLYDTHYTERYLGTDTTDPAYAAASLIDDAPSLSRPLLIVHGMADDNVVAAHTLRLSRALTEAGRGHAVLPLSGITHMTAAETVAENLLLVQLEFLRAALHG
jgi:dipeptidyl-peptidase-4